MMNVGADVTAYLTAECNTTDCTNQGPRYTPIAAPFTTPRCRTCCEFIDSALRELPADGYITNKQRILGYNVRDLRGSKHE